MTKMALDRRTSFILLISAALVPLAIAIRTLRPAPPANNSGYKEGDLIPLLANRVYSFNDRCDSRQFFQLPVCPPKDPTRRRKKNFREIISGDCYKTTQYELKFKVVSIRKVLCEKNLSKQDVAIFRYAIKNTYDLWMYYPENSSFGMVLWHFGRRIGDRYYIFQHMAFHCYYVEKQVKMINILEDKYSAVDITEDAEIKVNFTYSVFWKDASTEPTKEQERWQPQGRERWAATIMSLIYPLMFTYGWVLVLGVVVPYLKDYFSQYSLRALDESRGDNISQHIRLPPYSSLLGAILGNGTQALVMISALFGLSYKGILYTCNPPVLLLWLLLLYSVTSAISGFKATSFHLKYCADGLKECVFQTGAIYLVPFILTILYINTMQKILWHGYTDLPDFWTSVTIGVIWGIGITIFLILGATLAYCLKPNTQAHYTTIIADIMDLPQPSGTPVGTLAENFLGGLIPFVVIFRDMDEIYASLLNGKVCHAFRTLLLSFIIVIITTILVGVAFTYYQLSKRDLQWWWRSVFRGGSTAIFMFAYGIYFCLKLLPIFHEFHAGLTGLLFDFLGISSLLGYIACIFYAFFLALGTVGFYASSFVFHQMHQGPNKHD